ncbi:MAG: SMC-Scp complex subunit ScpB [Acutalibacteraceae bacterium]
MTDKEIKAACEAVLFACGESVNAKRIAQALELDEKKVEPQLEALVKDYENDEHGIAVIKLNDSYLMCNKKQHGEAIRRVMDIKKNTPLSQAALEVLAVIAYNQPVTKAFIEQVRGVDCSGVIGSLTTKNLIEEKGRLELPGRPLLYGTTENFLKCFQISSLEELPELPKQQENKDENSEEENTEQSDDNTENE